MIGKTGAGSNEVGEEAMKDVSSSGVEGDVETAAEVVVYGVESDVQNCGC